MNVPICSADYKHKPMEITPHNPIITMVAKTKNEFG